MRQLSAPTNAPVQTRYTLLASSAAAEREWNEFMNKQPAAAIEAYTRLTMEPLERIAGRQFPLKGQKNKPFWEYEATSADRIYYAVDVKNMTVIIAVRNDIHTGPQVASLVQQRRKAADNHLEQQKKQQKRK